MVNNIAINPLVPTNRTTKKCPRCKAEKQTAEFNKSGTSPNGLRCWCKDCCIEGDEIWRNKNRGRPTIEVPKIKKCTRCGIEKPGSSFDKSKGTKSGLNFCCKECRAIRGRQHLYGVSEEWYNTALTSQGGACAVCGFAPAAEDRKLSVDHDHVTGKIRGLLCDYCNLGIGHFMDSVAFVQGAIAYINDQEQGEPKLKWKKHWAKNGVPRVIRDRVLAEQELKCRICRTDLCSSNSCLDHCHKTGAIRGYLCRHCNCGLGKFKDSVDLLQKAGLYLLPVATLTLVPIFKG